jgi:hypothetical protein
MMRSAHAGHFVPWGTLCPRNAERRQAAQHADQQERLL